MNTPIFSPTVYWSPPHTQNAWAAVKLKLTLISSNSDARCFMFLTFNVLSDNSV